MKTGTRLVLVLSLLLNLGVVSAVGWRAYQDGDLPPFARRVAEQGNLADYLRLNGDQRRQWDQLEAGFIQDLKAGWQQLGLHREQMIGEIFSDQPDRGRIEQERAAIASLQTQQQQRIIEQLLKEGAILSPDQRAQLARLLTQQSPAPSLEERLHGR
jgi:Spy/CpxP family protein refolding chaperone